MAYYIDVELFLYSYFSFAFLCFSCWKSVCCIVSDGRWLHGDTQKTLPSHGAAPFRQSYHCFLHALCLPGSSVHFTWSGWNTGKPSLWVTFLWTNVRTSWTFAHTDMSPEQGQLKWVMSYSPLGISHNAASKPVYHPHFKNSSFLSTPLSYTEKLSILPGCRWNERFTNLAEGYNHLVRSLTRGNKMLKLRRQL